MITAAEHALIERDVEAYLRQHEQKELLRLVVVGSVDDGKSTLIGRLLHDTGGLFEDQLAAVKKASARGATRHGGSQAELDLSLVTDGLRAEREQGITIDVAYRYFATATRKFIIADTPGHVQYTRNMATGASTANVAVILIDARLGVLAQTRRHAYLAALLGIPHLVACVNKMDLVDWDRAVYERISAELTAFAHEVGVREVTTLPVSALRGDGIVRRGDGAPWYHGPTLLEHLERVPVGDDRNLDDLRFPVQYVIRPGLSYRGFAGQIASGVVRAGDEVMILPSGMRTTVASIDTFEGPLAEAFAPMSVTLRLADEVDVSRGDIIVHPERRPRRADRLDATVVWMSERPLDPARSYLVKHATRVVRADIERVAAVIDPGTLEPRAADTLQLNDIGELVLRPHQPLLVDAYRDNRATGAFIVIDSLSNDTVAAGMIRAAGEGGPGRAAHTQVSAAERAARLGQRGGVIEVGGDPEAARRRAFVIERVLFDAGLVAAVVPPGAAAAVAEAGVFAIVPGVGPDGDQDLDDEGAARRALAKLEADGRIVR